jgi:hypothetical protein
MVSRDRQGEGPASPQEAASDRARSGPLILGRLVRRLLPKYSERREQARQHTILLDSFRRERDPDINALSTPPKEERIELHSIWLAEVYPPSTVVQLIDGLEHLGWGSDLGRAMGETNLAAWVASSRAQGIGGSWANIGVVTRPGKARFLGPTRETVLPDGVDYALGSLSTLTPSMTVLTMQFVLQDSVVETFDAPLHATYQSFARHRGRFTTYIDPGSQKRDAMVAARQAIRDSCAHWIASHLPGMFSSQLVEGRLPSCEFITTQIAVPLGRDSRYDLSHYMTVLVLDKYWAAWESGNVPGVRLRLPAWGQEGDPNALLLVGRYDDIFRGDDMQDAYGGRTRGGFAARLENYINRALAVWALRAALIGYQQRLTEIRDRITLPENRTKAAIQALDYVRKELLVASGDVQRVSKDVLSAANEKRWFSHLFETDFEPVDRRQREYEPSLIEILRNDMLGRAQALSETEQHVRETLLTSSNLASTTANLRIQRRITALTWVLLILSILALAVPAYQTFISQEQAPATTSTTPAASTTSTTLQSGDDPARRP